MGAVTGKKKQKQKTTTKPAHYSSDLPFGKDKVTSSNQTVGLDNSISAL